MICEKCGCGNPDSVVYCRNCSNKLPPATGQWERGIDGQEQLSFQKWYDVEADIPPKYKPLGMASWIGYCIVFALPCIGLIAVLICAFGSGSNINLKNYARARLCLVGIYIGIFLIFSVLLRMT